MTAWEFGVPAGARYGLVAGSLRLPHVGYGLPFGAGVWAGGYAVLPVAGRYQPIREYDRATLAKDLVYGLTTTTAFRLLPTRGEAS